MLLDSISTTDIDPSIIATVCTYTCTCTFPCSGQHNILSVLYAEHIHVQCIHVYTSEDVNNW